MARVARSSLGPDEDGRDLWLFVRAAIFSARETS